jgi:hypothetical protein
MRRHFALLALASCRAAPARPAQLRAPAAQGELIALRSRSNGTDSQPFWIFPLDDWFEEGAGPLSGKPMTMDSMSTVDVAYPQRLFYLLSDPAGSGFHLATFSAVFGKTNYTPFADGAWLVGGSFHFAPFSGEIVGMLGAKGNGTNIELASWSPTVGRTKVRYHFPAGYSNVYNYGGGFMGNGHVYYAYLLHQVSQKWHFFAIDLAGGALIQPISELRRAPGQCTGSACLQSPMGFAPSVLRPGLAYGIDVDAAGGQPGFQVAELNLSTAVMRPIGKIPAGQNWDYGFRFLSAPPYGIPVPPAEETYYALLGAGAPGVAPATVYGVNVTHGGGVVSEQQSPWAPGGEPKLAHWMPAEP